MIKVEIKKENKQYRKISLFGHALYADHGKDIVCSACSSIVITTVNACLALDKNSLSYMTDEIGMIITVNNNDHVTQTLIQNMVSLLEELGESYPDNIKVK